MNDPQSPSPRFDTHAHKYADAFVSDLEAMAPWF